MRLLVACPACRRQYNATGRPVGSRFRCRCGTIVTIAQLKGHEAAVVRCASCGAPRRDEAPRCEFCRADFTLRDRHLNIVCPRCLARIGDGAQFCDHCGHPLAAESLTIEETALDCPTCGPGHRLNSRPITGDEVYECQACAGIWIGTETFRRLVRHAEEDGQRPDYCLPPPLLDAVCTTNPASRQHRHYVPCPVCQGLMIRQSVGYGVIVDLCKRHGIWFDGEKLTYILDAVRADAVRADSVLADSMQPDGLTTIHVERHGMPPDDPPFAGHSPPSPPPYPPPLPESHDHDAGRVSPGVIAKAIDILASIFGR